jgi:hypothetical protein
MSNPLVSIIITNHNYGRYLAAAIDSALAQTYRPVEVVVVDDGSSDGSRELIAQYGERVITRLQDRGGQGAAYNAGFEASRGEIICLLDADDTFLETKVARVVAAFQQNMAAAWLQHKLALTDGSLRPIGLSIPNFIGSSLSVIDPRIVLEHKARFVVSSGMALRRETARLALPILESEVSRWETCADAYVGMLSAGAGPCYSLDEVLALYRQHRKLGSVEAACQFLERTIRIERQLSAVWSERLGQSVTATDVFKHAMVLDALRGGSLLSVRRWQSLLRGFLALPPVARRAPALAFRQAVSLTVAFLAPRAWMRRVSGRLGFGESL